MINEVLIEDYSNRPVTTMIGVVNNVPVFSTPNYTFNVDPTAKDPNVDYEGTAELKVANGHASIEFAHRHQTITLEICLLSGRVREMTKLVIDGEVDPRHGKFGRQEDEYETLMAVKDAKGNFIWGTLDLRPLLDALIELESLPKNALKNMASPYCSICGKWSK